MKNILVSRGKSIAIVDDEDYEELNKYRWGLCGGNGNRPYYAVRTINKSKKKGIYKKLTIYMHKEVMSNPNSEVDHVNHNTLDNRKCNLRTTDHQHNGYNLSKYRNNTSGYKGVSWHKRIKKYKVTIVVERKHLHLGYFDNLEEAAKKYDEAAIKYHKEFSSINGVST